MARINYPTDFLNRTQLFFLIRKKHDNDGPASPLTAYLAQQNIDLAADATATNAAVEKHDQFEENARNAEEATEARNNLFNPVFARLRGSVQYLKGYYKGNEKELGLWGVQVNGRRIVYPEAFLRRTELFNTFKARHDALGAASPLTAYLAEHNIDLGADGAAATEAGAKNDLAKQAGRDAEELREGRDNLFNPVFDHVRSMGQYLKALYVKNPKELGHWGYTVDDSPRKGRKATVIIEAGTTRVVKRLLNGKELTNKGPAAVVLRQGKDQSRDSVTIGPGKGFTIMRGWSTVTVVNSDQAQIAILSVEKAS
jgi:hypothetical protein